MIDFRELNSRLDALSVVRALRMMCHSIGDGHWRGKCPFHVSESTKSRSLAVNVALRKWYCHKCKQHGDLIDLWAGIHHVSVLTAAHALAAEFGIE